MLAAGQLDKPAGENLIMNGVSSTLHTELFQVKSSSPPFPCLLTRLAQLASTPLATCDPPVVAVKPTQASSMWSSLISYLRSNVTVKRRLVHLRSHSDCFLGSEAVDVLIEHITKAEGFEGASISREKVACVCQALMDCDVFEAVGTKVLGRKKKQDAFEDSRNALYRFAGSRLPSVEELERGSLINGIQELFCRSPSDGLGKQVDMSIPATELKTPEKFCHLRSGFTAKGTMECPVDGPSKEQKDPALPQSCPSSDDQTGLTPSLAQWKLQLYRTLVRHYSDTARSPLLPQNMTDVHAAITDLLGASLGLQASIGADSLKKNTNQELWILLNNIHLDNKMSEKERRRLLRQFYLSHPEIYNQYFGETAATEL
ncbi:PREDICTED: uncharacterized protein LOC107093433 [Cyprinodon variegatus]|uniref:uncharacterized protein LOC107093433 n=1 Tax=Cyprinodon variegatus TaxID=28743 RepID=UPI0007425CB4|nr:PREDICTED: uncharacterized protein LOC107093433 [Cyprinodon variegatus]